MERETASTSSLVRGLATLEKVEERVREDNRLSLIGGTSQHGSPYLRIWGSRALAVLNHTPLVEVVVVPQLEEEEVILCTLVSFRREVLHSATFNTGDLDTRTGSSSLLGYLQSRLGQNYSYCHGFPEATLLTSLVGHQLNAAIFSKCLVERDVKGGQSLVVRSRHCQSVRPQQGPEDEERETLCSVCFQLLQSVLPPTKRTLLEDKASEQEEIKSCPVESCNRSFRREKPYQRHLKSHVPVKCDICSLAFLSETQLESHKKNAHTITSTANNEDVGNFVPPSNVLSEKVENLQKSETPSLQKSRQFSCSICGAVYHYEKAFQKHVQTHKDDITKERFNCDQCNHIYQTEEQLTDHKEQKHTYFDCDQCDSKSSSLKALDKHKRKLHSKTHEQCHICGKNVKRASMNNHVKMVHHADQMRRHICTICGNKYKTKTDLDRHYTKHTGQRQYTCPTCGKGFRFWGGLDDCLRRHENSLRHSCSICGKGFNSKFRLGLHLRTHSGERPFKCPTCTYDCARKDNLLTHIRRSHRFAPEEAVILGSQKLVTDVPAEDVDDPETVREGEEIADEIDLQQIIPDEPLDMSSKDK